MRIVRLLLAPFGYLAFVGALAGLSGAARLLGENHELGFFSQRLAQTLWRSGQAVGSLADRIGIRELMSRTSTTLEDNVLRIVARRRQPNASDTLLGSL